VKRNLVNILIIGAGLSGLLAAVQLQGSGKQVTLIDKGQTTGGRLATRAIGPGFADTGAQFFTVREPIFQHYVEQWQRTGLVYVWSTGWSDGSLLGGGTNDGYPRYAVHGGMNALANHLTQQLIDQGATIHTGQRISAISQAANGWVATDEAGTAYGADALVLTPPVPQSLALLAAGQVTLTNDDRAALERIAYAPCLCGIFWLEGEIVLPEPGAIQRPGTDLTWVADNQRKGISPAATMITIHAGPTYSRDHNDTPDEELLATFQASLQPFIPNKVVVHAAQIKRWRYALPTVTHPARYLQAEGIPPLYFGGDAFGGPRVEGAALSGVAIGRVLAEA
jgi:predicted NAD/FAD-dependent oxidoreductase